MVSRPWICPSPFTNISCVAHVPGPAKSGGLGRLLGRRKRAVRRSTYPGRSPPTRGKAALAVNGLSPTSSKGSIVPGPSGSSPCRGASMDRAAIEKARRPEISAGAIAYTAVIRCFSS
jgi:hypothetical protein